MKIRVILSLGLICLSFLATVVYAGSTAAATLLVPYFEVDLSDPLGRNTLFSIGNATGDPVLAHVVLWTDWSAPTLSFDLLLGAEENRPLNLRQILAEGSLPISGTTPKSIAGFPGCTSPLTLPPLDSTARATLRAQHVGEPHPENGLCYASVRADSNLLIGFITIDVVNDCSASVVYPHQEGYFGVGGTGRASNHNALWGDLFLIDGSEDSAQGIAAVPIRANAELTGATALTFYRRLSVYSQVGPEDGREPLGCRSRARFLDGGGFDGGTDWLLWTEFSGRATEGRECAPSPAPFPYSILEMQWRNQTGEVVAETVAEEFPTLLRVPVGEAPAWSSGTSFGTADVSVAEWTYYWNPPQEFVTPSQSLIVPVYSALGRYSVGLEATVLEGGCD